MLAKGQQPRPDHKHRSKDSDLTTHSPYKRTLRAKIPRIANKQIPLHSFGVNLAHLPLSKQHADRSKIWHLQQKESSQEHQQPRSLYNRPVHLLRQYLERKEKLVFHPLISSNPESPFEDEAPYKQFVRTANEFRINKNRKLLSVQPPLHCSVQAEQPKQSRGQEMDFVGLNIGKNIYEMSQEELEQSIRWKKHFLDSLNQKIRHSRTSGFTRRAKN